MKGQRQQAYAPRLSRRLNIDGTPVNSRFFKIRSAGPDSTAKTERIKGSDEQRVNGRRAYQK